jgi:hypothetical protein
LIKFGINFKNQKFRLLIFLRTKFFFPAEKKFQYITFVMFPANVVDDFLSIGNVPIGFKCFLQRSRVQKDRVVEICGKDGDGFFVALQAVGEVGENAKWIGEVEGRHFIVAGDFALERLVLGIGGMGASDDQQTLHGFDHFEIIGNVVVHVHQGAAKVKGRIVRIVLLAVEINDQILAALEAFLVVHLQHEIDEAVQFPQKNINCRKKEEIRVKGQRSRVKGQELKVKG